MFIVWGCPARAEIIPLEPDLDNASAGNDVMVKEYYLQVIPRVE